MTNKTDSMHSVALFELFDCLEQHVDEDPATVEYEAIDATVRIRFSDTRILREKLCTTCDHWLTTGIGNFAADPRTASGDSSRCRACAAEAIRIRQKGDPEKARAPRARSHKRQKEAGLDLIRKEDDQLKAEASPRSLDCRKRETALAQPLEFDDIQTLPKPVSNAEANRPCLCDGCISPNASKSTDFGPSKLKVVA